MLIISLQSYYSIVDYIPHSVLFTTMTYLFYNWRYEPLNPFHLVCPSLHPFLNFKIKIPVTNICYNTPVEL